MLLIFATEAMAAVGPFTSVPLIGDCPSATALYASLPSGVAPHTLPNGVLLDTVLVEQCNVPPIGPLPVLYTDENYANHLISIIRGETVKKSGTIYLSNKIYTPSPNYLYTKNEICIIEENSVGKMLFKNLNVIENLSYPICNKFSGFWLNRKYRKSLEQKISHIINPDMFKRSITELPQDDLQKIVYCKFLLYNPKLVVCIKPFSVVDAQNRITEKMIAMLAENGISVLIITSGWPSLSSIHGKILYLTNGTLSEK